MNRCGKTRGDGLLMESHEVEAACMRGATVYSEKEWSELVDSAQYYL
jgi:hypothetical protein